MVTSGRFWVSDVREFLAMKEKEMESRYLEVLQGPRLEFENLLAQPNAALAAHEEGVQSLMKAASDAKMLACVLIFSLLLLNLNIAVITAVLLRLLWLGN